MATAKIRRVFPVEHYFCIRCDEMPEIRDDEDHLYHLPITLAAVALWMREPGSACPRFCENIGQRSFTTARASF
jgi:hypothetical protein